MGDGDLLLLAHPLHLRLHQHLVALEMHAAVTWWHVRKGEGVYEEQFSKQNKLVGLFVGELNKRGSGLWFAPPKWKQCRLIWDSSAAIVEDDRAVVQGRGVCEGVEEGWKGFVYAMEGVLMRRRWRW
ncbi:uncharacterized protein LOC120254438 [Dioscorea cayenensis subsp. rotundata]|uniref:Uncharacterized protein LOC120254438 n=1 Tax=Dioscorea cayennensis subsp. rotundata TaxID=55577 RepID=A0AB40AU28_DIOCR|nr:uncharacterized protein LOC120254438 [Dioscorea cayenensis subsp. rotundata]